MGFRRPSEPAEPSEPGPASFGGWDALLTGRPPVEQALTRAVLIARQMLDYTLAAPGPGALELAEEKLRAVRDGGVRQLAALIGEGERLVMPGDSWHARAQPSDDELLLVALDSFLMLAIGTGDYRHQRLAAEANDLALAAATRSPYWRPMVTVQLLLGAEHCAEARNFSTALGLVDDAIETLGYLAGDFRDTVPAARASAEAARKEVLAARSRMPMTEEQRDRAEQEAEQLGARSRELRARGDLTAAREVATRGIELVEQVMAAFPGRHGNLRTLAAKLYQRATILDGLGEHAAAAEDARRSGTLFEAAFADDEPDEAVIADVRSLLAEVLAKAAAGAGRPPDPATVEEVVATGADAVEAYRRLRAGDEQYAVDLGRVLSMYAMALRLVDQPDRALAAERESLDCYRAAGDPVPDQQVRYFAQAALGYARAQLAREDYVSARDAAADACAQYGRLIELGRYLRPATVALAIAEFTLGYSKLLLRENGSGQHFTTVESLLRTLPRPLPPELVMLEEQLTPLIERE